MELVAFLKVDWSTVKNKKKFVEGFFPFTDNSFFYTIILFCPEVKSIQGGEIPLIYDQLRMTKPF